MKTRHRFLLVIVLALLIPIVPFALIGELPGERWLSAADANALSFATTGAGLLASDVLLPVPSSIVGTLMGARLGFAVGGISVWVGLMLGNMIGYGVGRLLPGRLEMDLPRAPTLLLLFLSRPVPVLAEAATIAAGAGRTRALPFLLACAGGNAVYALALAGNGSALLPDAPIGPGLALPMTLPVVAWLVWRWLAKRETAVAHSSATDRGN